MVGENVEGFICFVECVNLKVSVGIFICKYASLCVSCENVQYLCEIKDGSRSNRGRSMRIAAVLVM